MRGCRSWINVRSGESLQGPGSDPGKRRGSTSTVRTFVANGVAASRRLARLAAAVTAVVLMVLAGGATISLAAPGDLDTTFAPPENDGIVLTDAGTGNDDYGRAIVRQPDGKLVAAGRRPAGGRWDFVVTRYLSDGSLDTSFGGGDGIQTTNVGGDDDFAEDMALQSNGKIVVVGRAYHVVTKYDFAVARYNADGTLDTSFGGGDGKLTTDVGAESRDDFAYAVALQTIAAEQKIVVVGYVSVSGGVNWELAIVRYNADGTLDTGFGGGDGIVITHFSEGYIRDSGHAVAIDEANRIVVGGFGGSPSQLAVARFDANGDPDPTFGGGDGVVMSQVVAGPDEVNALALQADGKIVVAGYGTGATTNQDFALARFEANGTVDTSFGTNGIVTHAWGRTQVAEGVLVQPDGKIVAVGRYNTSSTGDDILVARYNADGSFDTSFSDPNGWLRTDVSGVGSSGHDHGFGVLLQEEDAKLVVVGNAIVGARYDIAVLRYEGSVCGNTNLEDPPEQCDDGDTDNNDVCPDTCEDASCGDGFICSDLACTSGPGGGGEECDDGAGNDDVTPDACRTDCGLPWCGDAVLDSLEECDDGGSNSNATANACRTDCTEPICGDGVTDSGYDEDCDDGGTADGDGCSSQCKAEAAPERDNRKCVVGMNKKTKFTAEAQGRNNQGCVDYYARGKLPNFDPPIADVEECLSRDAMGKLAKRVTQTRDYDDGNCVPDPPPFGYTGADAVIDSATAEATAWMADLFGDDLDLALVTEGEDKDGWKCQSQVAKNIIKMLHSRFTEFIRCKNYGLKPGVDPADSILSATDLETDCFQAIRDDGKDKIERASAKLIKKVLDKRCATATTPLGELFPGACTDDDGSSADFRICIDKLLDCRACRVLNEADGLDQDCDLFDDGLGNGSCRAGDLCGQDGECTVFATSQGYSGNIGGLAGADAECNSLAQTAGLDGSFVAWLSTTNADAIGRLNAESGPFSRPSGCYALLADDVDDLTDGALDNGIGVDENCGVIPDNTVHAWTGTTKFGMAYQEPEGSKCNDWAYAGADSSAVVGWPYHFGGPWTIAHLDTCDTENRIYCVEQ